MDYFVLLCKLFISLHLGTYIKLIFLAVSQECAGPVTVSSESFTVIVLLISL